jgi:hypothetical protein
LNLKSLGVESAANVVGTLSMTSVNANVTEAITEEDTQAKVITKNLQ